MTPYDRISASVDTRLVPGKSMFVYSTRDHWNGIYVRNRECWTYGIDLTCASPWNSAGGDIGAGTAISPIHIALANHLGLNPGVVVRFVSNDDKVHERTIVETKQVPGDSVLPVQIPSTDILIAILNAPLPPAIAPSRILPNAGDSMLNNGYGLPTLALNQSEKATIADVMTMEPPLIRVWQYTNKPERQQYFEKRAPFDSGNPIFIIFESIPIMICHLLYSTTGGAYGGPSYLFHKQAIQATMDDLSTRNKLPAFQLATLNLNPREPFRPPVRQPLK